MPSDAINLEECPLCQAEINGVTGPTLSQHIPRCPEREAALEGLERRSPDPGEPSATAGWFR